MPDVGVLNLQIHDDSAKAAEGLGRLATALGRVKAAVGSGLKLGGIANNIERINKSLEQAIPEQSLANLERFAAAVEKLNATGGVKLSGMKKMAESFSTEGTAEKIRDQIENGVCEGFARVQSQIQETSEQIGGMNSRMESFNQLVQQTAWSAGDMAEQFRQAFKIWNEMRMFSSLGSGNATPLLGDGSGSNSTGWQYYNPWGNVDETKWTEWKDGAIEAEYTISDSAEQTFDEIDKRIEGTKTLLLGAGAEAKEAVLEAGAAASESAEKIAGYKRVWDDSSREWQSVGYTQSEWDSRLAAMEAMREAMSGSADNSGIDKSFENTGSVIDRVKEKIEDFWARLRDLSSDGGSALGSMFETARSGIGRLLSPLASLGNQLTRVAKYRMLRAVIKEISGAVSEGTENYYRYSQAIGSSFAPAMDSAASSIQRMKNSIGAALAPLIQSLIPYLQIIVNWFITLVNYANQFIALMRGQATWSRATDKSAKAFDDVKKSANNAGAAIKDLLADWDELNIIQSETNPSGSGGGSAKKMQDYLGMFEEVGDFNSKIKSIMSIIEKGFGDIWNLAKLIGLAIVGWKVSNAFGGFIGTLGALLAGTSMITIGIQLGYGSGFSAGEKGFFDGTDLISAIAAAVAGGIGGWIITRSPTGIAIGVGISLIATLTGYIEGMRDSEDKLRWGDTSMTPEEVEKYVLDQFSFDISARIHLIDAVLENQKEAKSKLEKKIGDFGDKLDKVKIKVDGSPEGIADAVKAAGDVVSQINENLKTSEKNIEVLTKITPISSENGEEDNTEEFLSGIKIADATLSEYFTNIGKDIAKWIDEGEKSGWKNSEAEMAMALMQHQQEILGQAEQNKTRRSFQVDTELNISSMTRDTANDVLERQTALIDEYTSKMREAYENQVKELYYYADLANAAGLVDENGNALSDTYVAAAQALMEKIESGEIYDELSPDIEKMKEQWVEQLKKVYGGDIDIESMTKMTDAIHDLFGKGTYFEEEVKKALNEGGVEGAAKDVENQLTDMLNWIDPKGIVRKAASTFGFSIFDILQPADQKQLIESINSAVGGDSKTAMEILHAMGISDQTIAAALNSEIDAAIDKANAVRDAGKQVMESMWEADWQHMADAELVEFISAMREKFGSDAVDQALSELDIPVSQLRVPVDTTVEESVETVTVENGEGADTVWNNLGAYYQNGTYQLPDAEANVNINYKNGPGDVAADVIDEAGLKNIEFDASDMTVLGIPTDGGWLGNLINSVFNGTPLETDATVHLHLDADDEDVSILDLIEDDEVPKTGRLWNLGMLQASAGARSGVRYVDSRTGDANSGGQTQIAVTMDTQEQRGNIQSGVQSGTGQLLATLQSILNTANAINQKNFTVNIVPSSAFGNFNAKSGQAYGRVTGETVLNK